jgi:hypothetical protein
MKINQSRVKVWRRCHAAYSFKYVDNIRPRMKKRPFHFGSIVHNVLEAHANGDDPFVVLDAVPEPKMFSEERELYGDIISDIRYIMTDYFKYWKGNDLQYIRKNGRNAEHEFEIPLTGPGEGITFVGKIDGLAKWRKRLKVVVEHKTFKRQPTEDVRWRNVQSSVYQRACELLGWGKFDGILWDYIGNKPPKEPEILKSGLLSRRTITTLPSVIKSFLAKNNLSTAHYKDYIVEVEARQSEYFIREATPVNDHVVDKVFADFVATAQEIRQLHGKDRTKSIDFTCGMCDYESICRAELLNLDVDFVRSREYITDVEEIPTIEEAG